jgi:predicted RecA/RadA family phage recombinase
MAHSISNGEVFNYTCTGAVTNGALLIIGDTPGVALTAGTTGDVIAVALEGVFTLTKKAAASTNWAAGGQVYYVTTGGVNKLTGVAAAGKQIGTGWAAAVTGATTGSVKLIGGAVITETQT